VTEFKSPPLKPPPQSGYGWYVRVAWPNGSVTIFPASYTKEAQRWIEGKLRVVVGAFQHGGSILVAGDHIVGRD